MPSTLRTRSPSISSVRSNLSSHSVDSQRASSFVSADRNAGASRQSVSAAFRREILTWIRRFLRSLQIDPWNSTIDQRYSRILPAKGFQERRSRNRETRSILGRKEGRRRRVRFGVDTIERQREESGEYIRAGGVHVRDLDRGDH